MTENDDKTTKPERHARPSFSHTTRRTMVTTSTSTSAVALETGKTEKKKKRSGKRGTPYLDRVNAGPRDTLHGREYWKQLLIQPIIVPDLRHTGIITQFDDPSETDLLRPDGKSTLKLKSLIKTQVEFVDRIEAEEAGLSPLSPMSGQDGFFGELAPVPHVEDMALALSPTPRAPLSKSKKSVDFADRQKGANVSQDASSLIHAAMSHEKTIIPKKSKKKTKKIQQKETPSRRKGKTSKKASTKGGPLSNNSFKMFESMLDSVYGK